jgi:hypothetical protein
LWRWQKDPKFQQALRERRREAFSQTVSRLQLASTTAVDTLLAIMADQEAPAGSRVRAAQCVVIKGGAIIDHETPDKRRFVAVPK